MGGKGWKRYVLALAVALVVLAGSHYDSNGLGQEHEISHEHVLSVHI